VLPYISLKASNYRRGEKKMLKNKRIKAEILLVWLIGLFLIGIWSNIGNANTTYTVNLTRGTEILEVIKYDETEWNKVIGGSTQPNDWLEGNANLTGATNKITIRSVDNVDWGTFDVLNILFKVSESIPVAKLPQFIFMTGFNQSFINTTYPNVYKVAVALSSEWSYTAGEFEESPDNSFKLIPILKNPLDYNKTLTDYNDWVDYVNPTMVILGEENYTKYTGEEFLLKLIYDKVAIPSPINTYLTNMVSELGGENVTIQGNTITIQRTGLENYSVQATYGDQGTLSSFIVKNAEGTVIYEIALNTLGQLALMILEIALMVGFVGIIIYFVRKRKKTRKI
jgi:hypothetical protein